MSEKYNILIVDDEKFILNALRRVLISEGYKIFTTINPHEAIEILKKESIDVLISDQRMPIMPGIKLLNLAKDISPESKRVLISGFSDHKSPEDFINDGEIVSYISKPWIDEELKLIIRSIIDKKKLEKTNNSLLEKIKVKNTQLENSNIVLSSNIKNKKKQIQFVHNIIEKSKIQIKIINNFLYIINESNSTKDTLKSLYKVMNDILKFQEIGIVIQNEENTMKPFVINVLSNKKSITRFIDKTTFYNIKTLFKNKHKMITSQKFNKSIFYDYFKECLYSNKNKTFISIPLFNKAREKNKYMGFLFLSSVNQIFTSSKTTLFIELLNLLAKTIPEIILFDKIKEGGTQWEETFDAITDPLIIINKKFVIVRSNIAAQKLTKNSMIINGKKCHYAFAQKNSQCVDCPLRFPENEGSFVDDDRHYKVTSFQIGNNYLVYYKNYTNAQQLYYKLIQSDKMAAIGELAGQVAHEINNPLAGLLAYSQLLIKETKKESLYGSYISDLREIENAAKRCRDIVENLLSFSNSQRESSFTNVDIIQVVEKTFPLAKYVLKVNKIEIKKNYEENLPLIKGNFSQLQQVVFNLITNACHAMTGGGTLSINISSNKMLSLVVSDTGSGIPPSSISKIFAPFYTTKEKNIGTGLGLYICHEIINRHSGTISVKSKPGQGTSFTIKFPTK